MTGPHPGPGARRIFSVAVAVVGVLLLWLAVALPDRVDRLTPTALITLPLPLVAVGALVALVAGLRPPAGRRRTDRIVALGVGLLAAGVTALTVLKFADLAFEAALGTPVELAAAPAELASAADLVVRALGPGPGRLLVAGLAVGATALIAGLGLAVRHGLAALIGLAGRRPALGRQAVLALAVGWLLLAAFGVRTVAGDVAVGDLGLIARQAGTGPDETPLRLGPDPLDTIPPGRLLSGLRGHDVLLVFVESYGRVAVEPSAAAPGVAATVGAGLDRLTTRWAARGLSSRTAYLTSPTFAGLSWHAHSTLQSGLWIDSESRYRHLLGSSRSTLSSLFGRAGWRTAGDLPADTRDWPEGQAFYHWDTVDDSRTVGYHGPPFGYGPVPDEYTLKSFAERRLDPPHRPLMAEIDLVSSHGPWAPLPRLVPWDRIGDGSVYAPMAIGPDADPAALWRDPAGGRAAYATSIDYSFASLDVFLDHVDDPGLVLVLPGDHQPATAVTGLAPGHDVPISIVSRDPRLLGRLAGWGWSPGLRPAPDAPVWPMDAFRDRFVRAFSG